ncbi:Putative amino-acid ABC transporter ATP-binding protein YecC, partial [Durusdinium trenchii]
MSIKEITGLLSSVGFSSPPAWLRPFAVLSNGQQFRVTLARALAELPELAVIDEFTSVVDREAAKVGSFAVQKSVRQRGQRLVAVTCHYDVIDWLDPDWVFQPHTGECDWRCERRGRPEIQLDIVRCDRAAWRLFAPHHYLSHSLSKSASCFAGLVDGRPATFTAVMSFPHPVAPSWREHRTVCLPDYQGVGLGNAFSELVASVMAATGRAYTSTTAHPAMIAHRARSPVWFMHRKPGQTSAYDRKSLAKAGTVTQRTQTSVAASRSTAGFRYCGPANREAAKALGAELILGEVRITLGGGDVGMPQQFFRLQDPELPGDGRPELMAGGIEHQRLGEAEFAAQSTEDAGDAGDVPGAALGVEEERSLGAAGEGGRDQRGDGVADRDAARFAGLAAGFVPGDDDRGGMVVEVGDLGSDQFRGSGTGEAEGAIEQRPIGRGDLQQSAGLFGRGESLAASGRRLLEVARGERSLESVELGRVLLEQLDGGQVGADGGGRFRFAGLGVIGGPVVRLIQQIEEVFARDRPGGLAMRIEEGAEAGGVLAERVRPAIVAAAMAEEPVDQISRAHRSLGVVSLFGGSLRWRASARTERLCRRLRRVFAAAGEVGGDAGFEVGIGSGPFEDPVGVEADVAGGVVVGKELAALVVLAIRAVAVPEMADGDAVGVFAAAPGESFEGELISPADDVVRGESAGVAEQIGASEPGPAGAPVMRAVLRERGGGGDLGRVEFSVGSLPDHAREELDGGGPVADLAETLPEKRRIVPDQIGVEPGDVLDRWIAEHVGEAEVEEGFLLPEEMAAAVAGDVDALGAVIDGEQRPAEVEFDGHEPANVGGEVVDEPGIVGNRAAIAERIEVTDDDGEPIEGLVEVVVGEGCVISTGLAGLRGGQFFAVLSRGNAPFVAIAGVNRLGVTGGATGEDRADQFAPMSTGSGGGTVSRGSRAGRRPPP